MPSTKRGGNWGQKGIPWASVSRMRQISPNKKNSTIISAKNQPSAISSTKLWKLGLRKTLESIGNSVKAALNFRKLIKVVNSSTISNNFSISWKKKFKTRVISKEIHTLMKVSLMIKTLEYNSITQNKTLMLLKKDTKKRPSIVRNL